MFFIKEMFLLLNKSATYAVLRNWEGLPDNYKSRDIDIIIYNNDYKKIEKELISLMRSCGLCLIIKYKSERFYTLILGEKKSRMIFQIDFFFHCSARGIVVMDSTEMLEGRVYENGIYHVSEDIEFLDKFLFNILVGQKYPDKYLSVKYRVRDNIKVYQKIERIFNCTSIEEVENTQASILRKRALKSSLRIDAIRQIKNTGIFLTTTISNWLFPQGISIGVTGVDGVGKTTIIRLLNEKFSIVFPDIKQYHFRPGILPNIGETLYKMKINKEVDKNFDKPHRGEKTGAINSLCRLFYYSFDYIAGYFVKIRRELYRRNIVIFDRYYTDIIVDGWRSKIFLPVRVTHFIGNFIPSLKYNFLIIADEKKVLQRKQELDEESIICIQKRMKMLKGKKNYYLVTNDDSINKTVDEIIDRIFQGQERKYSVC